MEAGIVPTRHAALRALGTAAEFLTREPGGLIVLPDLADLVALAGRARTEDLLSRMRQLVRDADGTLLACTSRLTEAERAEFRSLRTSWWTLPDPAVEIQALLARSFGPGAGRLLDGFLQAHGLARSDVTTAHVEALAHFLHRAVGDLARGTGDARAVEGLRDQVAAAASALRTFAARTPADLSAGNWPSAEGAHREEEILVKASDYWRGKEMEELFAAASAIAERGSVYERTRAVFVDLLGDAGEAVLRTELAKLGKEPGDLTPRDLARLADRAAVDLGVMADVTDLPQEKDRIRNQVESIRRRLAALTGDEG